ncbi:MAG: hypothetical protein NUV53_03995 [Patescibacteria group bacterium]|nr:hypothetical protein [Patescibacteria group bacterium]
MKFIIRFFDKLEDKVRGKFSHYPILYAVVGGVGTVLFWRGVWHTADFFSAQYFYPAVTDADAALGTISSPLFWDGFLSLIVGILILLVTGLFVASFIGEHIIISGLRHEKKVAEKTEAEVIEEESIMRRVHQELHVIGERLEKIESSMRIKKKK